MEKNETISLVQRPEAGMRKVKKNIVCNDPETSAEY